MLSRGVAEASRESGDGDSGVYRGLPRMEGVQRRTSVVVPDTPTTGTVRRTPTALTPPQSSQGESEGMLYVKPRAGGPDGSEC